jgi:glycosyltransferase involved in cell wall biosynthesis
VLTVSRHSAERLAAAGVVVDASRVGIIPNGVDHILRQAPASDVISRHGLGQKPFLLGFASGQPHKNTKLLLDIAEADLGADMCIALIGSAPEGVALPPRVKMLGRVTDAELRALYEAAFAFLLPSKTEGFGLPAGEAMMCGAPVIVADAGALSEVWAGGALLASPDKPQDWVDAIRALAADPARRDTLRKAGLAHTAGFTWDASAAKLRAICEQTAPA